jgi:hypothetical protein
MAKNRTSRSVEKPRDAMPVTAYDQFEHTA